jgi:hypothetical protein
MSAELTTEPATKAELADSAIMAALSDMRATMEAWRADLLAVADALRADNEAMRAEMARLRAQLGLPGEPDLERLSEYDRSVVLTVSQLWRDQYRRPVRTAAVAARMNWSSSKILGDLKRLAREEGALFEHPSSGDRCSGLWSPMMQEKAG